MYALADTPAQVERVRSPEERGTRPATASSGVPILVSAYTSQLALGTLDAVLHPSVALGVEFPRGSSGMLSYFPVWRVAYEHHTDFQQRVTLGVLPSLRLEPHPRFGAQLGVEIGAAYLRSLWTPYRFDASEGTWSKGESELRFTWQFGAELTLWVNVVPAFDLGAFYGLTFLYPLAPENGVPLVPLTKLGLCARWTVGK